MFQFNNLEAAAYYLHLLCGPQKMCLFTAQPTSRSITTTLFPLFRFVGGPFSPHVYTVLLSGLWWLFIQLHVLRSWIINIELSLLAYL